jgi:hypothetical protein
LHSAFWKKPLNSILSELTIDTKTFLYVPTEVLKDLGLHHLNYFAPHLLIREEYDTALAMLTSWEKPEATGVVVTGHPGIGA